ncbi:hypothetical protein CEXT_229841 [Caerostris extrusa]|uniref:Uncharacterized protein n=1 Tax=Caerostris extrusa TaxID=172846 RepID=A0AAV4MQ72_CAEEX|nr:hypothetical protein CEXT_229841 [Caerostris extrusa]
MDGIVVLCSMSKIMFEQLTVRLHVGTRSPGLEYSRLCPADSVNAKRLSERVSQPGSYPVTNNIHTRFASMRYANDSPEQTMLLPSIRTRSETPHLKLESVVKDCLMPLLLCSISV